MTTTYTVDLTAYVTVELEALDARDAEDTALEAFENILAEAGFNDFEPAPLVQVTDAFPVQIDNGSEENYND